jgi:hypothetical protein
MRAQDFLAEWKKQYRHMMHGTSDAFLRGILKQGLKFDSGFRSWTGGAEGSNAELPSLGGVYFTDKFSTAKKAARAAASKHGGRPIIIDVFVTANYGYADEDLPAAVMMDTTLEWIKDRRQGRNDRPDSWYTQQIFQKMPSGRFDKNIYNNTMEYVRVLQKILKEKPELDPLTATDYYNKELRKRMLVKEPELKAALEKVSKSTRPRSIPKAPEYPGQSTLPKPDEANVRIERDIGFSGTTRIISIYDMETGRLLFKEPNTQLQPETQRIIADIQHFGPSQTPKYPTGHEPWNGKITDNRYKQQAEKEAANAAAEQAKQNQPTST